MLNRFACGSCTGLEGKLAEGSSVRGDLEKTWDEISMEDDGETKKT